MLNVLKPEEVEAAIAPPKKVSVERQRMQQWLDDRIAAGRKKPSAEVVTITPVLAQLLLEHNPINRPISSNNSSALASDIANARFQFNGESIVVSDTGLLLDGQHRLETVVRTGVPIQTVIVFGPKEQARYTIDTGKPKSVANFLAMKGRAYTKIIGSAASFHLQWRAHGNIAVGGSRIPTKAEILEAADELKGLDTSAEFTAGAMKTVGSHAVVAFCHLVFWKRSTREDADFFATKLIHGDDLRKGDPILYCRNRMLQFTRGVTVNSKVELLFKCWNAHRLGTRIDHVKLTGTLPKLER